jgi:hypothetical protein
MAVLSRYETGVERSLYRALQELQRFQGLRGGTAIPVSEPIETEYSVAGEIPQSVALPIAAPLPMAGEIIARSDTEEPQ